MLVARHCNHPKTWPSSASRHPLHTVQWRRNKRHETEPTHQFLNLYCRGEKPWFHLVDFQTNFGIIVEINHLKIARNQRTAKRTVEVRKGENLVFKCFFVLFKHTSLFAAGHPNGIGSFCSAFPRKTVWTNHWGPRYRTRKDTCATVGPSA